jgi:predicted restriction endonuclease
MVQWQTMKEQGFVPESAKGVAHEARNGILLCVNHHTLFNTLCYYIRWVPEVVF